MINAPDSVDSDLASTMRWAIIWMGVVHVLFIVRFLLQIVKACRKGKMPVFIPFLLEDCTCFISSICTINAWHTAMTYNTCVAVDIHEHGAAAKGSNTTTVNKTNVRHHRKDIASLNSAFELLKLEIIFQLV